jgi:hypothetical protein
VQTPDPPSRDREGVVKSPIRPGIVLQGAWHLNAETVFLIGLTTRSIPDSLTVAARL